MPRLPKLGKKKLGSSIYCFTRAGGDTSFGNVETSRKAAKRLFATHLGKVHGDAASSKRRGLSAGELMDLFLDSPPPSRAPQQLHISPLLVFVPEREAWHLPTGAFKRGGGPA